MCLQIFINVPALRAWIANRPILCTVKSSHVVSQIALGVGLVITITTGVPITDVHGIDVPANPVTSVANFAARRTGVFQARFARVAVGHVIFGMTLLLFYDPFTHQAVQIYRRKETFD